jgi:hypothetical protein
VGLISASYGSTQIKAWSSLDSVAECGATNPASPGLQDPSRVAAVAVTKNKRLRSNQLLRGTSPEPPDYYRPALTDGFTPQVGIQAAKIGPG